MVDLAAFRERLRLSLWFIPGLFGIASIVGATALLAIDRALGSDALGFIRFGGTAEGARSVLSTIAQSMLTFTGLVFSITMLVLQLASSQLSPRVMRTFLRDRKNQVVLGLFVATFVFTLLVLREVRTPIDGLPGFVPGLSIWVAFALLLASVAAFIVYIDHMAHSIRPSSVIERIAEETRAAVEHLHPEQVGRPASGATPERPVLGRPTMLLKAQRVGVLVAVHEEGLMAATSDGDRVAELVPRIGEFVPEGGPLFRLWGEWDAEGIAALRGAVEIGRERTVEQDPAFGIRQLVDIALRALSPGINDPTTASQAIDQIHDLLRRLASREFPSPLRKADDGQLRLVLHRPSFEEYLSLGVDEVRLSGASQLQIVRRLRAMLEDLAAIAPPDRRQVIDDQLSRLDAALPEAFNEPRDRRQAAEPSGSTPMASDVLETDRRPLER